MSVIFGEKIGMTSVKTRDGRFVGATVVRVVPNVVVRKKTKETDKYDALVVSVGEAKKQKKPILGIMRKVGDGLVGKCLKEIRSDSINNFDSIGVGYELRINELFSVGDIVSVQGVTKGKGFQGVMKRFHFSGGPATHGSNFHRHMGAVGMREWPGKIRKGKPMPGRMGGNTVTIKGLQIIDIDGDLVSIKGSIPGQKKSLVRIALQKKGN